MGRALPGRRAADRPFPGGSRLSSLARASRSPRRGGREPRGGFVRRHRRRYRAARALCRSRRGALRRRRFAGGGRDQAFVVVMLALAKAGDAVILPTPWYFNHKMTLDMLGIEAVALPCRAEDGFVPDPGAVAPL